MNATEWETVANFAAQTGFDFVFTINAIPRLPSGVCLLVHGCLCLYLCCERDLLYFPR
jgi:hypothetical protein